MQRLLLKTSRDFLAPLSTQIANCSQLPNKDDKYFCVEFYFSFWTDCTCQTSIFFGTARTKKIQLLAQKKLDRRENERKKKWSNFGSFFYCFVESAVRHKKQNKLNLKIIFAHLKYLSSLLGCRLKCNQNICTRYWENCFNFMFFLFYVAIRRFFNMYILRNIWWDFIVQQLLNVCFQKNIFS